MRAEVSTELSRLISPLALHDSEHFRATMAEIIARCRTSSLGSLLTPHGDGLYQTARRPAP
jgi:hypothetical protein